MSLPTPAGKLRWIVDVATALTLCIVDLLVSWSPADDGRREFWIIPVFAAAGYVALIFRLEWPRVVFGILLLHGIVGALFFPAYIPTLGILLALYTVAAHSGLRSAVAALVLSVLPAIQQVREAIRDQSPADKPRVAVGVAVGVFVIHLVIFGVGRWVSWSVRHRELMARRSAQDAVARERVVIARDLHDVVAHSVTLMLLQAGGAARLLRTDPSRAEIALRHVDNLGQQAIVELHRMVGLMRLDPESPQSLTSPPGLRNLPDLVNRMRSSDQDVELVVAGVSRSLEPGVDLTAYRIAQEALTNATRYGAVGSAVRIDVRWRSETLELSVVNDRAPGTTGMKRLSTGQGVVGMQERVRSVQGDISIGPRPEGVFVVQATLPAAHSDVRAGSEGK